MKENERRGKPKEKIKGKGGKVERWSCMYHIIANLNFHDLIVAPLVALALPIMLGQLKAPPLVRKTGSARE